MARLWGSSPQDAGHVVRVTGMLKEGAILATKAEMNVDGAYREFDIKGMM